MKKMGILINPYAKKIRISKKNIINDYFKISPEFFDVRVTESINKLEECIKEFKKLDYKYIGIVGGDGTLHQVITQLINIYKVEPLPCLLMLKAGTMNNLCRSLKLHGDGRSVLKKIKRKFDNNKEIEIEKIDTIKIDDKYCILFGGGAVTNFLNEVYVGEPGLLNNIKGATKAIYQSVVNSNEKSILSGFKAKIYCNDILLSFQDITFFLAGTVDTISPCIYPLYKSKERPDSFHIIVSGLKPVKLVSKIIKILFGFCIDHKLYFSEIVEKIKIISENEIQYTMDGDIYSSNGKLIVSTGPRIKFIKL